MRDDRDGDNGHRKRNMVVDMGGKTMLEGGGYDDHDGDDVRTEDYDDG